MSEILASISLMHYLENIRTDIKAFEAFLVTEKLNLTDMNQKWLRFTVSIGNSEVDKFQFALRY